MKQSNVLDNSKLYYEDLERKKVKTTPGKRKSVKVSPKPVSKKSKTTPKELIGSVKKSIQTRYGIVRVKLQDIILKVKHPRKKAKKLTKVEREALLKQRENGILGIGLLSVVVSIAYSTYIVRTFVNTELSLLALAPQVVFASCILLKAFSKLYK